MSSAIAHAPEVDSGDVVVIRINSWLFESLILFITIVVILSCYFKFYRFCMLPLGPVGLDPATIANLPSVLYKSEDLFGTNESEVECSICLGMFEDGERVKFLPNCQHCYHCECVDKWLSTNSTCPLCRASVLVESDV